ncbi:MAG: hypothetical protein JWP44_2902 [Mucilaginibacter sp.]|nr:hypothetical protein [Mucilaginibacter sp.]
MRKSVCPLLLVIVLCVAFCKNAFSQAAQVDSSSQQFALNNAVTLFHASLGDGSPLYNGPEYYFYDPLIKGNAYFLDVNAFTTGSVFYDGASYTGVPMLYDLYSDNVAVLLYNHFTKFTLIKEKVKSFDFLEHHFVNINADTISVNTSGIKSGFYDQVYNEKSAVLVKRSKSIQTSTGSLSGVEKYFSPATDYYLWKNNTFYSVNSQGALLNALKDRKKELEQYIKKGQIKFRKGPEEAMVKIVSYYDHLTN